MPDARTAKWWGGQIADVDAIGARIVSTMLHEPAHALSVRKFLKYSAVENDYFAFDVTGHHVTMRFKFRHTLFEFQGRKELAGEFDWYMLDVNEELTHIGAGIQVLTPNLVIMPGGETIEVNPQPPLHVLEQLEAEISMVILHAIQSRLVVMKRHE